MPAEWSAEQSEDVVLITDQDGIGELAVTTLVRESGGGGEMTARDVAAEESPEISAWNKAAYGGFSGVTGCVKEEGAAIQDKSKAAVDRMKRQIEESKQVGLGLG